MPRSKIHYAIIALTKTNVEEVMCLLKSQKGNNEVINWLQKNKSRVYGDIPEDWKPFGDLSGESKLFGSGKIKEIIENNSNNYHSETHLIDNFNDNSKLPDLSVIDVFFIDMFSMYLPIYKDLAYRNDQYFCIANKCCFLIDYTLPLKVQQELENVYNISWNLVSSKYRDGYLHRLASRIDDLTNFSNYLIALAENQDLPNSKTRAQIGKTALKNYPDKPLRNFSIAR